jgi:hypothetical protein
MHPRHRPRTSMACNGIISLTKSKCVPWGNRQVRAYRSIAAKSGGRRESVRGQGRLVKLKCPALGGRESRQSSPRGSYGKRFRCGQLGLRRIDVPRMQSLENLRRRSREGFQRGILRPFRPQSSAGVRPRVFWPGLRPRVGAERQAFGIPQMVGPQICLLGVIAPLLLFSGKF